MPACTKQARWPTSSASAAALCRRYQQTGQHHEHQLWAGLQCASKWPKSSASAAARSLDTGKRASIMSISCGPACKQTASKWPTSSASAAAPFPKYQQTGQHHEHQFWAGLPKASTWPTSSASSAAPFPRCWRMGPHHEHQLRAGVPKASKWPTSSASGAAPLFRYRQTGQHHEHQLWAGLQADSKQMAHIISISYGYGPAPPAS